LEQVLLTLKALGSGHLLCVFGCGGDRDKGKRPRMGAVATRIADMCVITSDNPRNENPLDILDDIVGGLEPSARLTRTTGCRKNAKGYLVEPDRQKAIATALAAALSGDVVLIAGKGHETYQIVGNQRFDFDDRRIAARALRQKRIAAAMAAPKQRV
jgi:UDP-N-acetylmuramyl tripeptide synthase